MFLKNQHFNFLYNFNKIILINEVDYIGDSIIFFWPLVNNIAKEFPQKEIQVFHPHPNVFKPIQTQVLNRSLTSFYKGENNAMDTIIIAFVKSDGELKNYLKSKEFPTVVKGMVGFDFSLLNMPVIDLPQNEYDTIVVDSNEIKYRYKNIVVNDKSSFPCVNQNFKNVYEYGDRTSKVLNIILKQGINTAVVGHKGLITLGSVYLRQNQTNDEIGRFMKPLNSIYFGDKEAEGVMVKFDNLKKEFKIY